MLAILLLLLLLAFLFGTPAYTNRNHILAPQAGGETHAQYAGSGITIGTHHSGTVAPETGPHWLPATIGGGDGDDGHLRNLVLLRNIGGEDWHHGGGGEGSVPGEGGAGGSGDSGGGGFGGFGGGGSGSDPQSGPPDEWRFTPDVPPGPNDPPAAFVPPLESAISAVPEPESWVLMIVGLGATGAMLRRRRLTGLAPAGKV